MIAWVRSQVYRHSPQFLKDTCIRQCFMNGRQNPRRNANPGRTCSSLCSLRARGLYAGGRFSFARHSLHFLSVNNPPYRFLDRRGRFSHRGKFLPVAHSTDCLLDLGRGIFRVRR